MMTKSTHKKTIYYRHKCQMPQKPTPLQTLPPHKKPTQITQTKKYKKHSKKQSDKNIHLFKLQKIYLTHLKNQFTDWVPAQRVEPAEDPVSPRGQDRAQGLTLWDPGQTPDLIEMTLEEQKAIYVEMSYFYIIFLVGFRR